VLSAFGTHPFLVTGCDKYDDFDWGAFWREYLRRCSRQHRYKQPMGWTSQVTVEAHVVNIRDAAAPGRKGLLQARCLSA
jgi:hypothetical protein